LTSRHQSRRRLNQSLFRLAETLCVLCYVSACQLMCNRYATVRAIAFF